jgi:hypothetical protein
MDWSQIFAGLSGMGPEGFTSSALPGLSPQQFQSRWPTPGMTAETMPTMAQSPITPENIAKTMAARGIAPPPGDIPLGASLVGGGTGLPGDTPYRMPDQPGGVNPYTDWQAGTSTDMAASAGAPASPVSPSGVPKPQTSTDMSSQGKQPEGEKPAPSLADSLRGVKAPAAPDLQRLGTPAAPRPTNQIKGGEILALLQAMNAGGQGVSNYQLPSTLGQALLGRK